LQDEGLDTGRAAIPWFVGDDIMEHWLYAQLHEIHREQGRSQGQAQKCPATPRRGDAGAPPTATYRPAKPRSGPPPAPRTAPFSYGGFMGVKPFVEISRWRWVVLVGSWFSPRSAYAAA